LSGDWSVRKADSWLTDNTTVYDNLQHFGQKTAKLYKLNAATGKAEFRKEFGSGLYGEVSDIGEPVLSRDASAYC